MTPNFTMNEFTFSETATRFGIDNTPGTKEIENLVKLAKTLELVRRLFNKPIRITSGYRCSELNGRIGGAMHSQHIKG